jgi:hypothetical protein
MAASLSEEGRGQGPVLPALARAAEPVASYLLSVGVESGGPSSEGADLLGVVVEPGAFFGAGETGVESPAGVVGW